MQEEKGTNRTYSNEDTRINGWKQPDFAASTADGSAGYIDDGLLGYMSAEAAKENAGDEAPETEPTPEAEQTGKKGKPGRRSPRRRERRPFAAACWRSPAPFLLHATWPARHDASTPLPSRHCVCCQRKRAVQPRPLRHGSSRHPLPIRLRADARPSMRDRSRAGKALRALAALNTVAGNHSRFLFDFAPESIILRVTQDPAPRLLYCFDTPDDGKTIGAHGLEDRIRSGDILI